METFLERHMFQNLIQDLNQVKIHRDALKTQKIIHNIPLLPIGLFSAIFNISKKSVKNKKFKFSQFDTMTPLIL